MKTPTSQAVGLNADPVPELPRLDCFPALEEQSPSICTISSDHGLGVTVWSLPASTTTSSTLGRELRLELVPGRFVIIGRMSGGQIEYLDPNYVPTPIMPGSGKTILKNGGADEDRFVSRAHFQMRGHPSGILLVNGVPRRGGGIRAPKNGTIMLAPQYRWFQKGEEFLIERGSAVAIRLPNGTQLTIQAE